MDSIRTENIFNSNSDMVREFHEYFGHPIRTEIYQQMFEEEDKTIETRCSFIREEYDEFIEAQEANDVVEMADALCDLAYFVYGSFLCFGIEFNTELLSEFYDKYDKYNINNVDNNINININKEINKNMESIEQNITLLEELDEPYNVALHRLEDGLKLILDLTYKTGYLMGFDMNVLFDEVHKSNMTKLCITEEDAIMTVEKYKEKGDYDSPCYRYKDPYYVVYNESTGKILKSYKWETPQLESLI